MTHSNNPYLRGMPKDFPTQPGITHEREAVVSLPFVDVPAQSTACTHVVLQAHFRAKRFCVYADDATKLRVHLWFGSEVGGTSSNVEMPAAMFADGPVSDRSPFVLHCSECGAPTKEAAPKCSYCGAPFTWRLTETAFGQSGLALDFPTLPPGCTLQARFSSRGHEAIGVDAAFIGREAWMEWR